MKIDPKDPDLHYKMGKLYKRNGKLDAAIEEYQKALSIQPEFAGALNDLAIAYAVKGEYEKALSLLKKMAKLRPDNVDAPYYIACIYARQRKTEETVDWLKEAVRRGFKDWDRLKTDNNLENIRGSSYYKDLIGSHF